MAFDYSIMTIQIGYNEPVFGLWCERCLKPSGYKVPVYWLQESGVSEFGCIERCDDCGEKLCDSD